MKICPQCQTEYDDTRKFCRYDGSLLEAKQTGEGTATAGGLTCPQCGKSVEAGKQFCRYCGVRLEAPASSPRAARYTPGEQVDTDKTAQAILLRATEHRRRRQEGRRRVARKVGLGVAVVLLIVGGVFGYRKAREWSRLPSPQQEELIAKVDKELDSLSPKGPAPPPATEAATNLQAQGEPAATGGPPSSASGPPQEGPRTVVEDFSNREKATLASIKPEEGIKAAPPRPEIPRGEGQEYIRRMISYAMTEGGASNEEDIVAVKRRIEALDMKSRLPHGDRKRARAYNDRGLQHIQNWQFADAVQAFQDAHQADLADIEIINNLGYAHMQNGDFEAAEQFLLQTLVFAPDRSSAWADLGQLYARQGSLTASVACFANAYRFSRKKDSTRQFLQRLAKDGNDREKEAASQTLQLKLVRGDEPFLSSPSAGPQVTSEPSLPPGHYEVVRVTSVLQEPRRNASVLTQLSRGKKVNVVGVVGDYVRVESAHGRLPGYIFRGDIAPTQGEAEN